MILKIQPCGPNENQSYVIKTGSECKSYIEKEFKRKHPFGFTVVCVITTTRYTFDNNFWIDFSVCGNKYYCSGGFDAHTMLTKEQLELNYVIGCSKLLAMSPAFFTQNLTLSSFEQSLIDLAKGIVKTTQNFSYDLFPEVKDYETSEEYDSDDDRADACDLGNFTNKSNL